MGLTKMAHVKRGKGESVGEIAGDTLAWTFRFLGTVRYCTVPYLPVSWRPRTIFYRRILPYLKVGNTVPKVYHLDLFTLYCTVR